MSTKRYTPEFKDEAVRQVVERGYSVAEVADRLGVNLITRQCARYIAYLHTQTRRIASAK